MHVRFEKFESFDSKQEFEVNKKMNFHNAKIIDPTVTKNKPPESKLHACLTRN